MNRLRRRRAEKGFVTVEFIAGMGLLFMPVAILVMVFPTWAERQSMARVAAREAARTWVLTGSAEQAQATVDQIALNYHLETNQVHLIGLTGDPKLNGSTVTAEIKVDVPVTSIPIMKLNADAFAFDEKHTEVVDQFRASVGGQP